MISTASASLTCIGYDWFQLLIILFGAFFSIFYGLNAVYIFAFPELKKPPPDYTKRWWVHQYWINFVGSLIGWASVYILYINLSKIPPNEIINKITWSHIAFFIVGTLGIMGFLPYALFNLAKTITELFKKGL